MTNKRSSKKYFIKFEHSWSVEGLTKIGKIDQNNTDNNLLFRLNIKYFDVPKFSVDDLCHVLYAKTVLRPHLAVLFTSSK